MRSRGRRRIRGVAAGTPASAAAEGSLEDAPARGRRHCGNRTKAPPPAPNCEELKSGARIPTGSQNRVSDPSIRGHMTGAQCP